MAYQNKNLVLSLFYALKNCFLAKNAVKIQNFEERKKLPLDISEILVVSKFGPVPIKIVAGSLPEHTNTCDDDNGHFSTPVYQYTNIPLYSTTNLPTIQTSTIPLQPSLLFCYQALRAD